MGGVLIVGSVLISHCCGPVSNLHWTVIGATCSRRHRLMDDYAKMAKQRSGSYRQAELLFQFLIAGVWTVLFISTKWLAVIIVECQHSVFESHGGTVWRELYRPYLYLV